MGRSVAKRSGWPRYGATHLLHRNESFYIHLLDPFFDALDLGELDVVTSYVTLLEVLVQPIRRGDVALADRYRDVLLNTPNLASLPLTEDVAEEAARLRAAHNRRTPVSIHMATALLAGAGYFLTNDATLAATLAAVPGMQVLTLDALRSAP